MCVSFLLFRWSNADRYKVLCLRDQSVSKVSTSGLLRSYTVTYVSKKLVKTRNVSLYKLAFLRQVSKVTYYSNTYMSVLLLLISSYHPRIRLTPGPWYNFANVTHINIRITITRLPSRKNMIWFTLKIRTKHTKKSSNYMNDTCRANPLQPYTLSCYTHFIINNLWYIHRVNEKNATGPIL